MQIAQIAQGRIGRGGDVAATVVPAGLAQVEVPAGGWNELPEPDRVRRRVGEGVIGAFDDRKQRELQRHVALFEPLDDVMDVGAAALAGDLYGSGRLEKKRRCCSMRGCCLDAPAACSRRGFAPRYPVLDLGGGVAQPDRLLCRRHHCAPCLFEHRHARRCSDSRLGLRKWRGPTHDQRLPRRPFRGVSWELAALAGIFPGNKIRGF